MVLSDIITMIIASLLIATPIGIAIYCAINTRGFDELELRDNKNIYLEIKMPNEDSILRVPTDTYACASNNEENFYIPDGSSNWTTAYFRLRVCGSKKDVDKITSNLQGLKGTIVNNEPQTISQDIIQERYPVTVLRATSFPRGKNNYIVYIDVTNDNQKEKKKEEIPIVDAAKLLDMF